MSTRSIGQGWNLDLPDTFRQSQEDRQYSFWHDDKTIYAVTFPTTATTAEDALADFVRDAGQKPVQRYSRKEDGLVGEAWLLPEQDGEYWGLNTWTAAGSSIACVTFYFTEKQDVPWALALWKTVRPSLVAGQVQ